MMEDEGEEDEAGRMESESRECALVLGCPQGCTMSDQNP